LRMIQIIWRKSRDRQCLLYAWEIANAVVAVNKTLEVFKTRMTRWIL
jgi:hypothetical protein